MNKMNLREVMAYTIMALCIGIMIGWFSARLSFRPPEGALLAPNKTCPEQVERWQQISDDYRTLMHKWRDAARRHKEDLGKYHEALKQNCTKTEEPK